MKLTTLALYLSHTGLCQGVGVLPNIPVGLALPGPGQQTFEASGGIRGAAADVGKRLPLCAAALRVHAGEGDIWTLGAVAAQAHCGGLEFHIQGYDGEPFWIVGQSVTEFL